MLSYSRRLFLRFFLDARMDAFLTGHALAFDAFGGVPRVVLYDNLKSAVLERCGEATGSTPRSWRSRATIASTRAVGLRPCEGHGFDQRESLGRLSQKR